MDATLIDITLSRGSERILTKVSLELRRGETLFLRGPNGSGKSTLLRFMAGLSPSVRGEVNLPENIVYAGHLDAIKPTLSVRENLEFWASAYGGGDVETILDQMDLRGLKDRMGAHLSAGQKRRLGLARLPLVGGDLWLMDEPTTALDVENTARITEMIRDFTQSGGMAVIATHLDMDIPNARILDMTQFKPTQAPSDDPFLEGWE